MAKGPRLGLVDVAALRRLLQESQQRNGRYRAVVLEKLDAGDEPTPDEIAKALTEPAPDPVALYTFTDAELANLERLPKPVRPDAWRAWAERHISEDRRQAALEQGRRKVEADSARLNRYVADTYVLGRPRKPGPKGRSEHERLAIAREYFQELTTAAGARDGDDRRPRAVATQTKRQVAARHGIKPRQLETILRSYSRKN